MHAGTPTAMAYPQTVSSEPAHVRGCFTCSQRFRGVRGGVFSVCMRPTVNWLLGGIDVAGDTERIEKDIAKAREDLAATLDTLAVRANPKRLADDAKTSVVAVLNKPAVKYALAGVGVVVVAIVIRKVTT